MRKAVGLISTCVKLNRKSNSSALKFQERCALFGVY